MTAQYQQPQQAFGQQPQPGVVPPYPQQQAFAPNTQQRFYGPSNPNPYPDPYQQQAQQAPPPPLQGDGSDFFDNAGGEVVPSFWFNGEVGRYVNGTVLDTKLMYQTSYTDRSILRFSDGTPRTQLGVTLQTNLRNWEGVNPQKIPTDENGQPLHPSADDGRRRVYLKGESQKAVGHALSVVHAPKGRSLKPGDVLALRLSGHRPSGKGNPFNLFEARVQLGAGEAATFFDEPQQAPQAPQQEQSPAAPVQQPPAPAQAQSAPQQPASQDPWSQAAAAPQQPPAAGDPFAGS